ncbi:MAG TPA: 2-dehydropantoate 2-reductase [Paenibacillus sp.]|nr:2-dehydropantoate 2-reductase [Paenibacillus sp.]HUC93148.1 2-dehydropantoate 2-reductase [Paenibacillus sp.]
MKVNIVGGGAIGLSMAARLARSGADVRLWTRTERQARLIASQGISFRDKDGASVVRGVQAACAELPLRQPERIGSEPGDWVILTVKQTHLADGHTVRLIGELAGAGGRAPLAVLCLQNGIGHMERLREELPDVPLVQGVTNEGGLRIDERTAAHTGDGELHMGPAADGEEQKMLVEALRKAGIKAFVSKDILTRVYRKLLVNAVINPLTALFGVRNGELPDDPARLALMRAVHAETLTVMIRAGMRESGGEWLQLLDVCRRTADNLSSMRKDVEDGRRTEIAAINGGVAALAERLGVSAPLNAALVELIGALDVSDMK